MGCEPRSASAVNAAKARLQTVLLICIVVLCTNPHDLLLARVSSQPVCCECNAGHGRAGLDDVNEFESELEAEDKWKRRFRILQESSTSSSSSSADDTKSSLADESKSSIADDSADDTSTSSSLDVHPPSSDSESTADVGDASAKAEDAGQRDTPSTEGGKPETQKPDADDDARTGQREAGS
jgi:hypothetical protein